MLQRLSRVILKPTARNICGATVGSIVAATAARFAIDPLLPPGVPYFTYWVAVDVATIIAGWQAGAITVALTTLLGWYIWLPPRYSFAASSATLAVVVTYLILATLQMLLAALMRVALRRLEQSNQDREVLVRELTHRLKNQLAVFASIASSTLRNATGMKDANDNLSGRLSALAKALDLAVTHQRSIIELRALVAAVVQPLAPSNSRLTFAGEPIELEGDKSQAWALLLHELATNALKHGAWRGETGVVVIAWSREGNNLCLTWTEEVRQLSMTSQRKGFGTTLIEKAIDGAEVEHIIGDERRITRVTAPLHGADSA